MLDLRGKRKTGEEEKKERVKRKVSWSHTIQMRKSKWCKSDHLGNTYNAAGAAPGLPLLPKRPAKNCCTILERVKTESEEVHFITDALLFVLGGKSAASVTVKINCLIRSLTLNLKTRNTNKMALTLACKKEKISLQ